jgi:alpha 1,6-mannosyltransferase
MGRKRAKSLLLCLAISFIIFMVLMFFENIEIKEGKGRKKNTSSKNSILASNYLQTLYSPEIDSIPKIIHQQYSRFENMDEKTKQNTDTFKYSSGYLYLFWSDEELLLFVASFYPQYYELYKSLPFPVLRSDLARYLLLETFGGIYSDVDTILLKPIKGWNENDSVDLMVGIEVDTTRSDWREWYPQSLGFCQWTMVAAPNHPVLKATIQKVTKSLFGKTHFDIGETVHLTGPVPFTNAVLEYLEGFDFKDDMLRNLKTPKLIGAVLILPITAFSPGVGHMGSKDVSDKQAKVYHLFDGGWKKSSLKIKE